MHDQGLRMAMVTDVVTTEITTPQAVFLNEQKVIPFPSPNGVLFFDTGTRSHMTGERGMFAALDETEHGTVKFGDGSTAAIRGCGSIVFRSRKQCSASSHPCLFNSQSQKQHHLCRAVG